ncbi:hypothetical protein bwei_5358 [Bacillus mycoides]|uniref:hypothetical protein n=1 Tax=Bacillus mycoides TaxID=1405 RepID=UPI0001A04DB0|nr:hypothetical protein [Bacillus mycoides]AIW87897.1 hypothetical protein bwei_5358 [Bacillus mycoides]EEL03175.1 hypothetical protein bcere0014_52380 [Bacillus cereus BDRD-ST196]GAE42743.1 hypothetical protein BW1_072_00500 [Bacillus mycoides NBRC 101238 = DSM 11821]
MRDIYEYLNELQNDIFVLHSEGIERKYYQICVQLAGMDVAKEINAIDMTAYEKELKERFIEGSNYLNNNEIQSVYFEYDLDNNWAGQYYLCEDYYPMEEEDDDWACEWEFCIEGPELKEFSTIYDKSDGFDTTEASHGIIIFLIARTVIAYLKNVPKNELDIPVCIGFHDQEPIFRLKRD